MNTPKYILADLPYDYGDLEPAISERIMKLHHDKHHSGYVDKANKALDKLEEDSPNYKHVLRDLSFNLNGHILHTEFWDSMRKYNDQNAPTKLVEDKLAGRFDNFDSFKRMFSDSAKSVEGSGWGALLMDREGNIQIMQIENHNKLYISGYRIILLIDVWEHAYYLDYENDRERYLEQWWNVVNWDMVEKRLINKIS